MRVIPWSVELVLGTPGRWCLAHIHTFPVQVHVQVQSQSAFHNTAKHRRPHSTSFPKAPLHAPAPTSLTAAKSGTNGSGHVKDSRRHVHHSTSLRNVGSHPHADVYRTKLDALLAALRQCDTFKLYLCLLDLTRGVSLNNQSFCKVVQTIPPTTFSEILRNFDPFHVSSHVDSAPGINISWGAAVYSPLGDLINKWGVKVLYVRILNRLRLLQRARQLPHPDGSPSQIRPLLRDYLVLLRCAGATSDIGVAKAIWWELASDGYGDWRHAELYAEFIKARYLTETLYANNDLSRFRLRPLDLHRSASMLKRDDVRKLKRLEASWTDRHSHRFGQNVDEYYFAEPLTRLLRKRKPLQRLERRAIIRRMVPGDEMLLCAMLKANGRHGRVYASNILMRFWGINISNFKTELGNREISGGHDFPLGSALAPTEALLDAVVHCYGNMGEVLLAKALVDFISRRWDIAVPDKVWSDLLDFTRIFSTDPAAREWRIAQFHNKLVTPDLILDIWTFSTQAPHNFQPDMKDYYSLVKSMIGPKRPLNQFLEAVRQLTPLYHRTTRQMQVAWAELILATQQGVSNHGAYHRYRVLQSSKHFMWYCFHYTARQVFKKLDPLVIDSADAMRHIPDLVAELEPFLRTTIQYRIATGIVELRLDYKRVRTIEAEQKLHKPDPLSLKPADNDLSTEENEEDEPAAMDWAAIEALPNGATSSAALRDFMESIGIKQGQETQLATDKHEVKRGKEENAEQEGMERESAGGLDEIREKDETEKRIVMRTSTPEQHLNDAFDESRNPAYEPPAAKEPRKAAKKESALSKDPFADFFRPAFRDSVDSSSALRYSDDWDKDDATPRAMAFTRRQAKAQQLVERPAYMWRPRYSAPPGQHSLTALRQDGEEFTGFHNDPLKAHFAAHRILREIIHTPGVPVSLGRPGVSIATGQLAEQLLEVRT